MRLRQLVVTLFFLGIATSLSHAADYKAEYDKKIKASQDVGVLGDGLAGDSVNFYTGATSFNATDLSIPGNFGLSVALGRSYSVENNRQVAISKGTTLAPEVLSTRLRAFGDWDIEVPHISTVMRQSTGWVINDPSQAPYTPQPGNRCSLLNGNNTLNRPGFSRHLRAIIYGNEGGVNERQAIHGRVQGRGGQASGRSRVFGDSGRRPVGHHHA